MNDSMVAAMADVLGEKETLRMLAGTYGYAASQQWQAADGWIVGYTTERIEYAREERFNGRFAAFAYKPVGKGARSGSASSFEMTYFRPFAKRKLARARAEELWRKHNERRTATGTDTRAR